jgi:hypothetical protein
MKDCKLYNLFTERSSEYAQTIKAPGFDLIKRIYQRELNTIVSYYNSRVYAVKSNHILCRLLTIATIPLQYDLDRYVEIAYARSPYVAKHFNFTSEISFGKTLEGAFYGPGNEEIVIYNEEYFDRHDTLSNWKQASPIKVLNHNVSDLGLMLPNGLENSTGKGLCVISVNIPMLLVQYRGFMAEQATRIEDGTLGQLGVAHFVHMYVLPCMLKSHLDLVLLNRLKNLFYGAPMSEALKKHPFLVVDYSDKIDLSFEYLIKHLKDVKRYYTNTLATIPGIFEEDITATLEMPNLAPTIQVWWALIVTRLDTMKFLIDLGGETSIAINRGLVTKLKFSLMQVVRSRVLPSKLSQDLYYEIDATIKEILEL